MEEDKYVVYLFFVYQGPGFNRAFFILKIEDFLNLLIIFQGRNQ